MVRKVMIALNTTWNLVNFRGNLIKAMQNQGYEILAISPPDEYVSALKKMGCQYIPIQMDNKGTNIFKDLKLCYQFFKVLLKYRPDALITYTIKPNIYFSLVAHLMNIPVLNTVTGLGTAFIKQNRVTQFINFLYRLAFSRSKKVFFQNQEDLNLFLSKKLVSSKKADRVPGSGVDLEKFQTQKKERTSSHVFQFLFVGRVIADKGIYEYYQASNLLKEKGYIFRASVVGFLGVDNPGAVSIEQMNRWVAEGNLEYEGSTDDIKTYLQHADCVVLPSYREGISKALLEACAMEKPIITTDAVGCRELVEYGMNGYLCEVQNAADLAMKMEKMLQKDWYELDQMGMLGRKKIENEYDEKKVIRQYLEALESLC